MVHGRLLGDKVGKLFGEQIKWSCLYLLGNGELHDINTVNSKDFKRYGYVNSVCMALEK